MIFEGNNRGEMISKMLTLFDRATQKYGFDILLVCWDRNTYAAALEIRRRLLPNLFDVLDGETKKQMETLALKVRSQQVGLFLGDMGEFLGQGRSIPRLSQIYDRWAQENLAENERKRFYKLNEHQKASTSFSFMIQTYNIGVC